MYTLEDVREIFRELDERTGLDSSHLEIRNVNDTYTLGKLVVCSSDSKTYYPHHFEFSNIILDKLNGYETFRDVVIHEYCHFVATIRHKDNCDHDERFVKVCHEVADDVEQGKRIGNDDGTVLKDEVWDKWDNYIETCQNVVENMDFEVDYETGIITGTLTNKDVTIDKLTVEYFCDSGIEDLYSCGYRIYENIEPNTKHIFRINTTKSLSFEECDEDYKVDSCRIVVDYDWDNEYRPTVFNISKNGTSVEIMSEEDYYEERGCLL